MYLVQCYFVSRVGGMCHKPHACVIGELGVTTETGKPYPSAGIHVNAHLSSDGGAVDFSKNGSGSTSYKNTGLQLLRLHLPNTKMN